MKRLLETACRQADEVIERGLNRPCPVKSRLSPRGTIANPAPKALQLDGTELAQRLCLTGTVLERVTCEGGFLNFTLKEEWFDAAVKCPLALEEIPQLPPIKVDCPAFIHPGDWAFAGKKAKPELCARQDEGNPGWLVRITEERLKTLENRAKSSICWTQEQKMLLLKLASYDEEMSVGRLSAFLTDLARLIWQQKPHRIPRDLNRCCQSVLHNGRAVIYRKFTLLHQNGVK